MFVYNTLPHNSPDNDTVVKVNVNKKSRSVLAILRNNKLSVRLVLEASRK